MRNTANNIVRSVGRAFAKVNYAPAAVPEGRRAYKHTKMTKPWSVRREGAHQKAQLKAMSFALPSFEVNAFHHSSQSQEEVPTLMDHFNALEDALLETLLPQSPKAEMQVA